MSEYCVVNNCCNDDVMVESQYSGGDYLADTTKTGTDKGKKVRKEVNSRQRGKLLRLLTLINGNGDGKKFDLVDVSNIIPNPSQGYITVYFKFKVTGKTIYPACLMIYPGTYDVYFRDYKDWKKSIQKGVLTYDDNEKTFISIVNDEKFQCKNTAFNTKSYNELVTYLEGNVFKSLPPYKNSLCSILYTSYYNTNLTKKASAKDILTTVPGVASTSKEKNDKILEYMKKKKIRCLVISDIKDDKTQIAIVNASCVIFKANESLINFSGTHDDVYKETFNNMKLRQTQ